MKKLIILLLSIFVSMKSYGGIFNETICFETDGQNIVFLLNETNPYTGKYLCKYDNGQNEKEGRYKGGRSIGKWTFWYEDGNLKIEGEIISETESGGFILRDRGGNKRYYEFK